MAIIGVHLLINTPEPEDTRSVLADAFGFDNIDIGDGWLLFRLPAAELAVHPSDGATNHAISFVCDDIEATIAELQTRGVAVKETPVEMGWGIATTVELPGGASVMIYEPRHPLAIDR